MSSAGYVRVCFALGTFRSRRFLDDLGIIVDLILSFASVNAHTILGDPEFVTAM